MSELGRTINERIGDLRTSMHLSQTELSEKTGIPTSVISRIESGKTATVGHDVLAKLALFFNVSADYLLGLTDVRMRKNVELNQLGLSNQALFQILSGKVNSHILSLMIENKNFPRFLDYAQAYFEDANAPAFQSRNALIDFGIDALKDYAKETPEIRKEANHDINRINAEKITFSEASMIKLRDIMMSILKDMKESYTSIYTNPADIDPSQLTEMMNVMYEQAEEIRQERPVTADDMTSIVVNYLSHTGLNEKAQELLKELCLQMFENIGQTTQF